jgi:aryl carrier-like protein
MYVLTDDIRPAGIGPKGEIYAGGIGVSRGYLNDPVRTAEVFLPDPCSGERGARLYRTGDIGRYRADGNAECLGRRDNQVKVRGFRIEAGEIEAVLNQKEEVDQAVVVVMKDKSGANQLVAYVVAQKGRDIGADELRSYLKTRLPDYMTPARWVKLDAFPLNSNGKVDRRALPALGGVIAAFEKSFEAPRTPAEAKMADLWRDLLEVQRVGVHDNFFELGGHSLLMTQLVSRIKTSFGVELTLRALFEAPTLAEMTQAILSKQMEEVDPEELGGMLKELKQLSSDEIKELLSQQGAELFKSNSEL